VDVRVFGIEMRDRDPLQSCVQVLLYSSHQIASQPVQVDARARKMDIRKIHNDGDPDGRDLI
jgi:hypothetical protein